MENTILQDYRLFNYIYNDDKSKTKKTKELKKEEDVDEYEPARPVIKYPKDSKLENLKQSMKFKEEDSPLYVNERKSDSVREENKKRKEKDSSDDVKHMNMLNNIMF